MEKKQPLPSTSPQQPANDFEAFRIAMGFNGKQVSAAGDLIGLAPAVAQLRHRGAGSKQLSKTERLAMAARAAGLEPWTPEAHAGLTAMRDPAWMPTHQHYRGGMYRVVHRGTEESSMLPVVVYDDHEGRVWVRYDSVFHEHGELTEGTDGTRSFVVTDGKPGPGRVPRFKELGPAMSMSKVTEEPAKASDG